jgi:hypothetical protein
VLKCARVVKFQLNVVQTAVFNVHSNINDSNEKEGVLQIGNPRTLTILGNTWWQDVVNTKKEKSYKFDIFEYACGF